MRRSAQRLQLSEQVLLVKSEFIMTKFLKDESGATAIEYGLIAAAIGLMLIAVMPLLSTQLKATFDKITAALTTFNGTP
jgi:pilus assembly protein Flp/PilA